jgi:hypothetical protein
MNNTQSADLIFELSRPGRRRHRLPEPGNGGETR